jgi:DNA-binding beta-propeller fold protein YncE
MRSVASAILVLVAVAVAAPAAAQKIEHAGTVSSPNIPGLSKRRVGDPRYVALSSLNYDGPQGADVAVLDLVTLKVVQVGTTRDQLGKRFGTYNAQLGLTIPPMGELAYYTPERAGLSLYEYVPGGPNPHWYAELDPRSGAIRRSASLGAVPNGEYLEFAGADERRGQAWWVLLRKQEVVLRRLDLRTLAVAEVMTVPMVVRTSSSGYEDHRFIHASPDFSRFVVVDYYEDGLEMDKGNVTVIDPLARSFFTVNAPSTAYGVAFAPGGKHLYLGSCQHGTIFRLDVAKQKIDARIAGPVFLHFLAVSADGKSVYALHTGKKYSVFDDDLTSRRDRNHAKEVAPAATEMFGGGHVSPDGFFVVQQAGSGADYVVTQLL